MFALCNKRPEFALDTMQDVRNILNWMIENGEEVARNYGLASKTSIQTIQRKMLKLELNGATSFFGPTNFSLDDLLNFHNGKAVAHILRSEKLINDPVLYSTFLFWLLNELFTKLPEVGDLDKPKLVFFFDEAHLLFSDANKSFTQTIERVVRLIRSKGVGIYFITQSPADIPDAVLSQLGNRVQHALRAYTPSDQKSLRAAAESFRPNPAFDTAQTIKELAVGEALVSLLDGKGVPGMVQRTKIGAVYIPEGPEQVVNRIDQQPLAYTVDVPAIESVPLPVETLPSEVSQAVTAVNEQLDIMDRSPAAVDARRAKRQATASGWRWPTGSATVAASVILSAIPFPG
jgi:hypothetical protein